MPPEVNLTPFSGSRPRSHLDRGRAKATPIVSYMCGLTRIQTQVIITHSNVTFFSNFAFGVAGSMRNAIVKSMRKPRSVTPLPQPSQSMGIVFIPNSPVRGTALGSPWCHLPSDSRW